MIAEKQDHVKTVATIIANATPEAFAGYASAAAAYSFDLDRDFSEWERMRFLALAAEIVASLQVGQPADHRRCGVLA